MQPAGATIVFRCPKCNKPHRAMQSAVGKPITCSKCSTSFKIPSSDAAPSTDAAPVTYWQPVPRANHQPAEPMPALETGTNEEESDPVIVRRPPRRSFAIWKIAIVMGHLALIGAAVAVWLILHGR